MDKLRMFVVRNWKRVLVIGLGLVFCVACVWKVDGIYKLVKKAESTISRRMEYWSMHKENVRLDEEFTLQDEEDAWYTKYHFISHAGGGQNGRTYTNSLEVWENSYEMGNRVFDADMAFTSDGVLVLRHSWIDNLEQGDCSIKDSYNIVDANGQMQHIDLSSDDEPISYMEFMSRKIYYSYTPMSCEDMIRFMDEHKDLYVACDMKDDVGQSYQYIVDEAGELSRDDILDRIIVNLYDYESYDKIMNVYPFKNVTMRQHYVHPNNYYEIINFCLTHDVHVVNLSSCYIEDYGVQLLRSRGIHVYVAIVDYISDMKDYHALGADGAVTNWLYEDDWKYIIQ